MSIALALAVGVIAGMTLTILLGALLANADQRTTTRIVVAATDLPTQQPPTRPLYELVRGGGAPARSRVVRDPSTWDQDLSEARAAVWDAEELS